MNIDDFPTTPHIRKRIVVAIEGVRCNGNGDPDTNGPRMDLHGHGILSNASEKRIVRDHMRESGIPLYFERGADLTAVQEAYRNADGTYDAARLVAERRDLVMFGGSLTKSGYKAKGAIQFSDARSIDPVSPETITGTRVSMVQRTRRVKADDGEWVDEDFAGGSMFSYVIIPYALYRADVTYDEAHAVRIGLTAADLSAFWRGITEGWEHARSAHRMGMNLRRLYVFDGPLGRGVEPSHVTGARVRMVRKSDVEVASCTEDYIITVDTALPAGMTGWAWEDGRVSRFGA
jgi:CRISPR-associated protein Csd2